MDLERTIAGIEWLERIFLLPDTRPLSASDLAAANRRHVALGVKVERRLDTAVAKQALNGLRVNLALVHQPA